ncbi:helix-turn-helix domain-containing protein [Sphingomonas sp. DT-207]|uniref:helix-turn-helix domain-containing protein n=1 Tax=Sphingomonas sp. DT-207 TaxID=3396167 RepID=UPI003F1DD91A
MRSIALGEGDGIERVSELAGDGYSLRASRKHIVDRAIYRHMVGSCLLHVTLSGSMRRFTGRFGNRAPVVLASRPGLVSFAPPGWERYGALEDGEVIAAEVELDLSLVEASCEQRIDPERMRGFFNVPDAKTTAVVQALAGSPAGRDSVSADTLALTLARHVGLRMAGADRRRDDGWMHPSALRRVIERIDSDPAAPPRLNELAALAGLGPSAFIRAFRGAVGRTPAAFVLERRLRHARSTLLASEAPLEAIAADHGFSSKRHLITAFRRHFGVTPGSLRSRRPRF